MPKPQPSPGQALQAIERRYGERDLNWINFLVRGKQQEKFYGRLNVIFEDGKIVRIVEKKVTLPPKEG